MLAGASQLLFPSPSAATCAEGKLVVLELKSSPPKPHVERLTDVVLAWIRDRFELGSAS
jgi:hypothetical protein